LGVELLTGVMEGDVEIRTEQESEDHDREHPERGGRTRGRVEQCGVGFLHIGRNERGDQYANT